MTSVAEVIAKVLEENGIERVYGVPGDSIDPFVDAIRQSKRIKYIQVRHEEGAAFAAGAEAKITGKPAVCMGTSGPGSIHLINGLYDAKMDHIPLIALTGQVETDMLGHDYFQEVNLLKLMDDVSVFNEMVIDPKNAEYLIRRAIREAVTKKGVAHLNLPVNVLRMSTDYHKAEETKTPEMDYIIDFTDVVNMINEAKKPAILIGGGSRGASTEINQFAEKIGSPVIYALNGKGVLPDDDPKVMGGLGLLGSKPSMEAIDHTDLLIMLGTSFPYVNFFPKDIKVIQVDIDPSNMGKRIHPNVKFPVPVRSFLKIREKVKEKEEKYYHKMKEIKEDWLKDLEKQENERSSPLKPQRVARLISQRCEKDAVIVTDVGNVTMWTARHFRASGKQTFIFSPWLGSMGVGIPSAVGASLATGKQVIAFVGDGGFAMTMMEMITARKYNLPIKIIVYNNSKLGMIKFEQEVMGYPEWGVDLWNPDFMKLSDAMGFVGMRMSDFDESESVVEKFLNLKEPALLEAVVDPNERPMPPKLTFSQAEKYVISIFRERLEKL
ncbi:thiamine pyrophosphate-dependent enzyme [Sulfuracidifex metallicus]|uniref:2-oxoacid oxidoreductase (ferredoxin) n=1 Tax=Sulfuracidifex metallicus DSM 6482 = JCM 9184 TaxID=523847 RepID=A0A6A9QP06_SULME|nr:thiamine pyrophosphate-dependent enzyme [Sulfuracidifex metallicus]MUN29015.1 pyruvate oxidase [Sulfuracidifex metallicus DSM 6482 = JCM 9184]WOE50475.1 thiamine pyrophosphate-binding protein [Sulfuracidifex metallicus DSM 6482 = JCM 9184]